MSSVTAKRVDGKPVVREDDGKVLVELREFQGGRPTTMTVKPSRKKAH
jgi:hypothetical protein